MIYHEGGTYAFSYYKSLSAYSTISSPTSMPGFSQSYVFSHAYQSKFSYLAQASARAFCSFQFLSLSFNQASFIFYSLASLQAFAAFFRASLSAIRVLPEISKNLKINAKNILYDATLLRSYFSIFLRILCHLAQGLTLASGLLPLEIKDVIFDKNCSLLRSVLDLSQLKILVPLQLIYSFANPAYKQNILRISGNLRVLLSNKMSRNAEYFSQTMYYLIFQILRVLIYSSASFQLAFTFSTSQWAGSSLSYSSISLFRLSGKGFYALSAISLSCESISFCNSSRSLFYQLLRSISTAFLRQALSHSFISVSSPRVSQHTTNSLSTHSYYYSLGLGMLSYSFAKFCYSSYNYFQSAPDAAFSSYNALNLVSFYSISLSDYSLAFLYAQVLTMLASNIFQYRQVFTFITTAQNAPSFGYLKKVSSLFYCTNGIQISPLGLAFSFPSYSQLPPSSFFYVRSLPKTLSRGSVFPIIKLL